MTRLASVMVSRRCNMSCAHCSVESHPKIKLEPTEAELHSLVERLLETGVEEIQFTGGEPMLRESLVLELMNKARLRGVRSTMVSNGFWGKKREVAGRTLKRLRQAGLCRMALSYDRYHAEFQGPGPLLNILDEVRKMGWNAHINITRTADEKDLEELVRPFEGHPAAQLRFYDIQPVGMARNLKDRLRSKNDGFCTSCDQVTFTDNGRVIACNGPAYFEPSHSALVLGRYQGEGDLGDLVQRHAEDPILETIRVLGPTALMEELRAEPGFESFPFKAEYQGMCDVCTHLCSDPGAVEALRARLSTPARRAELLAHRLVRDGARRDGYHRHEVNSRLAPAAFLRVLLKVSGPQDRKLFGRADLDWARQAERLRQSGLLGLFREMECREPLAEWAPDFFWDRVEQEPSLELSNPGLETLLTEWWTHSGRGGMRCLYFIGAHGLEELATEKVPVGGIFLKSAGELYQQIVSDGSAFSPSWRLRLLRFLAFKAPEEKLDPWIWIAFPMLFSTLSELPKAGLESLKRLSRLGLSKALKAAPAAWREFTRRRQENG